MSASQPQAAALPVMRGSHVHHHLRGRTHGRLRGRWVLGGFLAGLIGLTGLGALGVSARAPGSPALCRPYQPCGVPPVANPLVNLTVWKSRTYGFSLEYPGNLLNRDAQTGSGLELSSPQSDVAGVIIVQGADSAQLGPPQALTAQLQSLPGVSQLSPDTSPAHQLLGPSVGYTPGAGGVYTGYLDASQGVGQQVAVYSQAATHGRVTIVVTVIEPASNSGPQASLSQVADGLINTVKW